jgi:hypothetical protein
VARRRAAALLALSLGLPSVAVAETPLRWAAPSNAEAEALQQALTSVWPDHAVLLVVGEAGEGLHSGPDGLSWTEDGALLRSSPTLDPWTQVALARSWVLQDDRPGLALPSIELPDPLSAPPPAPIKRRPERSVGLALEAGPARRLPDQSPAAAAAAGLRWQSEATIVRAEASWTGLERTSSDSGVPVGLRRTGASIWVGRDLRADEPWGIELYGGGGFWRSVAFVDPALVDVASALSIEGLAYDLDLGVAAGVRVDLGPRSALGVGLSLRGDLPETKEGLFGGLGPDDTIGPVELRPITLAWLVSLRGPRWTI